MKIRVQILSLPLSAAIMLVASSAMAQEAAGDAAGQVVFNNACRTCHTTRQGDNRLGPNLHGIIGRKAGTEPGYGYSSAMATADLIWDEATMDRFIANPDQVVPGNNMKPYGGLSSAEDRAKIIQHLKAAGGD
jgi:cytochrome c